MANWTNEKVFQFIKLYRAWPVIWDPKHRQRSDRNKVNEAWVRISDAMGIDIADLKKKKDKLMVPFRHFKRKRKRSNGQDNPRPMWIFFDAMNAFLGNVDNNSNRLSIENFQNRAKQKENESMYEHNFKAQSPSPSRRSSSSEGELDEADEWMKSPSPTPPKGSSTQSSEVADDECELYGKLLVSKLKKFPENDRLEVMLAIDSFMIEHSRNMRNRVPTSSPSFVQLQNRTKSRLGTEKNMAAANCNDLLNKCVLETFINSDVD